MDVITLLEIERSLLTDIMLHPTDEDIEYKITDLKEVQKEIIEESCNQVLVENLNKAVDNEEVLFFTVPTERRIS